MMPVPFNPFSALTPYTPPVYSTAGQQIALGQGNLAQRRMEAEQQESQFSRSQQQQESQFSRSSEQREGEFSRSLSDRQSSRREAREEQKRREQEELNLKVAGLIGAGDYEGALAHQRDIEARGSHRLTTTYDENGQLVGIGIVPAEEAPGTPMAQQEPAPQSPEQVPLNPFQPLQAPPEMTPEQLEEQFLAQPDEEVAPVALETPEETATRIEQLLETGKITPQKAEQFRVTAAQLAPRADPELSDDPEAALEARAAEEQIIVPPNQIDLRKLEAGRKARFAPLFNQLPSMVHPADKEEMQLFAANVMEMARTPEEAMAWWDKMGRPIEEMANTSRNSAAMAASRAMTVNLGQSAKVEASYQRGVAEFDKLSKPRRTDANVDFVKQMRPVIAELNKGGMDSILSTQTIYKMARQMNGPGIISNQDFNAVANAVDPTLVGRATNAVSLAAFGEVSDTIRQKLTDRIREAFRSSYRRSRDDYSAALDKFRTLPTAEMQQGYSGQAQGLFRDFDFYNPDDWQIGASSSTGGAASVSTRTSTSVRGDPAAAAAKDKDIRKDLGL